MEGSKKQYGFKSMQALRCKKRTDLKYCGNIYKKVDGSCVVVTYVTSDPKGEGYKWIDKESVGEVVEHVRCISYDEAWENYNQYKLKE